MIDGYVPDASGYYWARYKSISENYTGPDFALEKSWHIVELCIGCYPNSNNEKYSYVFSLGYEGFEASNEYIWGPKIELPKNI